MQRTDAASEAARTIVPLLSERGVATLSFNRPDKGNAFNDEMRQSFIAHFDELAANADVRVIILRGVGRHFCAGSDMSGIGRTSTNDRIEMLARIDTCPKPTVAVVQGACLGHGLGLICCCDVVLATSDAFFSIPEVRLGIPPLGLMPLLIRSMGVMAFRHHALRGSRFGASEAHALKLVHEIAPPDQMEALLATVCDDVLRGSPSAIRLLKQAWHDQYGMNDLHGSMRALAQQERAVIETAETRAGIAAARENRPPPWFI